MAVEYESFFPEVLPYAPDVAEPVALNAIRNAVIQFCDSTLIWQEDFTFSTTAGTQAYPVPEPLDANRAQVMRLWCDAKVMTPVGKDTLTSRYGRDWRVQQGRPTMFNETNGTLLLVYVPDDTYEISGQVAYKPTRDSAEVGFDPVYDVYLETIAAGALARLYSTMGAPYYNPQRAAEYERRFMSGIADGKIRNNSGFGRGQNRVQMRPFGKGAYPWR